MCAKGFFVRFERLLVLTLWVTPNYALKRAMGLVAPFACCYYMLVQYFMDEKKPTRYESAFFKTIVSIELSTERCAHLLSETRPRTHFWAQIVRDSFCRVNA